MNTDFLCESKLNKLSPALHRRVSDTAVVMFNLLEKYQTYFPEYTDHTVLHSLQVIDFCNKLIGEQIDNLNEDELYVLLMSCYLHDSGMGITESDYKKLHDIVVSDEYIRNNPDVDVREIIRNFHQDFSAEFIRKHSMIFDIPSPEHTEAIARVSRGHRKTDLFDEAEYPADFRVPGGNTVCLPYLASLIRLADELDIAKDRNIDFIYTDKGNIEFAKHRAIRRLRTEEDRFVLEVESDNREVYEFVMKCIDKLQFTIDQCADVVEKRTDFTIRQKKVEVEVI